MMGDILGVIASGGDNDGFSKISQALDYRQARLDADEAKRKQLETDQLVGKALSSGLQEGTVMHDLALKYPTAYLGITKVMGLDPTDGAGMHQLTQDVANIHALGLTGNPQAVSDYMTHVKEHRDKLGFNTTAITQGIQSFNEDPDKFFRANAVMNQALNPVEGEVMSAKDKHDADLEDRKQNWLEKTGKQLTPFQQREAQHWDYVEGKGTNSGNGASVNPDDIPKSTKYDSDAQTYRLTGKVESGLGGSAGTAHKLAVKNRANELDALEGISPEDVAQRRIYAAQDNTAASKLINDLSGKNSPVIPINKVMDHIDAYNQAFSAMNNGYIPLANTIINKWATATGHQEATTVDAMSKALADEIAKSAVGGQTAQGDREEYLKTLRSNASPEQKEGAINGLREMGLGALHSIKNQYEGVTKRNDFNERYLSPELSDIYTKTAEKNKWTSKTDKPAVTNGAPTNQQTETAAQRFARISGGH